MGACSKRFLVPMIIVSCYFLTSISLYRHSLREVLDAPNVMNMIKDTKAAQEVRFGLHFPDVSFMIIIHNGYGTMILTGQFSQAFFP